MWNDAIAGSEKISAEILSQWCLEAKQHASLRAMRKLMKVGYVSYLLPLPSHFLTHAHSTSIVVS